MSPGGSLDLSCRGRCEKALGVGGHAEKRREATGRLKEDMHGEGICGVSDRGVDGSAFVLYQTELQLGGRSARREWKSWPSGSTKTASTRGCHLESKILNCDSLCEEKVGIGVLNAQRERES